MPTLTTPRPAEAAPRRSRAAVKEATALLLRNRSDAGGPPPVVSAYSVASELTRCRLDFGVSQVRLSQLLGIKLHRLSDLEKARSFPQPREEQRLRRRLRELRARLRLAADREAAEVDALLGLFD